ncbi:MAG: hypothetical protein JJU11_07990 [Candidatus Sumerlaeia bacterium]|nr:hypothetical protein [Candidatus Sumerlaeia bacterium]
MKHASGSESVKGVDGLVGRKVHRVLLEGRDAGVLAPSITEAGLEIVTGEERADCVVVHGGDGSLLGADRAFPNLPKFPVRRSSEVEKCPRHHDREVFRNLAEGRVTETRLPRLRGEAKGRVLHGINDIVFHNKRVTAGVRYRVLIDGDEYAHEIVGDGLVAATPFGSSAYYRSITNSVFRVGIGLAFNNSTEVVNHLVLCDRSVVEVEVLRGPAVLAADNILDPVELSRGDRFSIRSSRELAVIWGLDNLLCHECRMKESGLPAGFRHV